MKPIATWPWPLTWIPGYENQRTFVVCGYVAAGSYTVPESATAGVVVKLLMRYQRKPLRPVGSNAGKPTAVPSGFTVMPCAV